MPREVSDMEKIKRQLQKLAFGKVNDCVKLALCEDVDIETLDLSLLAEMKKNEKGSVEVKLLDRTKLLEQLLHLADGGDEKAERFLEALVGGMEKPDTEKQEREKQETERHDA